MRDVETRRNEATALPRGVVIVGLAVTSWIAVASIWQVVHVVFGAILN